MLDAAIVPKGDAVLFPTEADLKDGFIAVLIKKRQNVVAFVTWDSVNMGCENGVHK